MAVFTYQAPMLNAPFSNLLSGVYLSLAGVNTTRADGSNFTLQIVF